MRVPSSNSTTGRPSSQVSVQYHIEVSTFCSASSPSVSSTASMTAWGRRGGGSSPLDQRVPTEIMSTAPKRETRSTETKSEKRTGSDRDVVGDPVGLVGKLVIDALGCGVVGCRYPAHDVEPTRRGKRPDRAKQG